MSDDASVLGRLGRRARSPQALVTLGVVVLTLALNLAQQPGLITFDTKLDLQFDPAGFLSRSLSLWNGDSAVGGLQNQASGYLFPMGPFFWLGGVLGVPMWVWERLWSAGVMLLAYGGARRLAGRWPGISGAGAVMAGLTYMLAPRVLTTVGGLSGETLPAAVLPWTVLPLALYLRGSVRGRVALLWSAATIPWMGGQNATLVLACLVLPAMLLAFTGERRWQRRLGDVVGWGGLVVLGTLWWLVPLFLLGGYAPPFLDFIESSVNTAGVTGWLTSLRGTNDWVAFFSDGGGGGWSGGYALASSAVLLVPTVAVAGAGLIGLGRPDLWARRTLVAAVLLGLTVLTLGSGGWAGSLLAGAWLDALNAVLAPLRNVHKFDPLLRLPLSLGLGAFVTGLPELLARSRRLSGPRLRPATLALTAAIALLVGAAAQPAASGHLRSDGGMKDISASWRGAVDYLDSRAQPVRALVLPGSDFATQYWGRTVDEPIQVLGGPAWMARAQVTVAPAGTIRLMDSIESAIDEGRPTTALSATLRRLGITHVVVRNDLDPDETSVPSPEHVYSALAGDPGLRSAARFGHVSGGFPAVEVMELGGVGEDPRLAVSSWADRRVVQGGPEAVGDLVAAGLVGDEQATVLGDGGSGEIDVATDSNRRVERSFGRVHEAVSGVMTRDEPFRLSRPVHDYTGGDVPDAQTTAEYDGATSLSASSSSAYAGTLGPVHPEEHPYAAFDGSFFTAWASAPFTSPVGQWIEARFADAVDPGLVDLQFDTGAGARVASVRLSTDHGDRTVRIGADGRATGIDLPGDRTRVVRMTVVGAAPGQRQVRLAELTMRDHPIRRSLRLPGEVRAGTAIHLSSESPRRACLTVATKVACRQSWQRETPETSAFSRTVEVAEAGTWRLSGTAVATNGPSVERLLAPLSKAMVRVSATSTFAGDPAVAAANAYDGRTGTGWYASPLDPTPGLQLSWRKKRTISGLRALLSRGQPGVLPDTLVVDPLTPGIKPQLVATTGQRAGMMTPVRTNRLRVTALPDDDRTEAVGISELEIDGLEQLRFTPDARARTGLVCGFGPNIEVAGRTVQTKLSGTLSTMVSGGELQLVPCGTGAVPMPAGTQRIRVTNPAGFAVSTLELTPAATKDESPAASPTAKITSWSPTERRIAVRRQDEGVLALPESSNRGWQASVDGARLEPVVVDGWKQGWRIPRGTTGQVELHFEPQGRFLLSILIGLLVAAVLSAAALATLLHRRRGRGGQGAASVEQSGGRGPLGRGWRRLGLGAGAVALAVVSVPLAVGAVLGMLTRRSAFASLSAACLGALLAAAVIAILQPQSVLTPPDVSDVLVALVVGAVAGRAATGGARSAEGEG